MTGLEGPAGSAAAKIAVAAFKRYTKTSEFDRLCERLANRFSGVAALTADDFKRFAEDTPFAIALGGYLTPPHNYDRDALIEALAPLVGALDANSSSKDFAALLADAIPDEVRLAKTGDSLARFENDRVIAAVGDEVRRAAAPVEFTTGWAPPRAQATLRALPLTSVRILHEAFGGKDLATEIPVLFRDPPSWVADADRPLLRALARLAEVSGCWSEAVAARTSAAERPGADRAGELLRASDAASHDGDDATSETLRARAEKIDPEHPLVRLVAAQAESDAGRRLELIETIPEPDDAEELATVLAVRATTLLDLGRADEAAETVRAALAADPYSLHARDAAASAVVASNRALRRQGRATRRHELLAVAETIRDLRSDLITSRRFEESGWMLKRVAEAQNLADRTDLARTTLQSARREEVGAGLVALGLAEAAMNAGDPQLAQYFLDCYSGDDPAAPTMRAALLLRDPLRRAEAITLLDEAVANGHVAAAGYRLIASIPLDDKIPWSTAAEELLRHERPAQTAFIRSGWLEKRGRDGEARRELARHADDPRAVDELLRRFAEDEQWVRAAPFARRLLDLKPPLGRQIFAAQVLTRAGADADAEPVLKSALRNSDALPHEREAAFSTLVDILLRSSRLAEVVDLSDELVQSGHEGAAWEAVFALARAGDLDAARSRSRNLKPRHVADARLAVDVIVGGGGGVERLAEAVGIADALPEPDEDIELKLTVAFNRCQPEELPHELAARTEPGQFVRRFPSNTAWRKATGPGGRELTAVMARAEEELAAKLAAAERLIESGEAPLSTLAAALARTLSETCALVGRLPLSFGRDVDDAEREIASSASGSPVAVDITALYTLQLLGAPIVDAFRAEHPLSLKAQSTMDDLLWAITLDFAPNSGLVAALRRGSDGRLRPLTVPPKEAAVARAAVGEMHQLASGLATAPIASSGGTRAPADGGVVAYADTVGAASAAAIPVYIDDRFARRELADRGVPSFGTLSLLDALRHSSAIDDAAYELALSKLRVRGAIGLPAD